MFADRLHPDPVWFAAFALATLLNLGLFAVLPPLAHRDAPPPPPVFRVNLSQWQPPTVDQPPPVAAPRPPPRPEPEKLEPKPEPKPPTPKPRPAPPRRETAPPAPSATEQPVLTDSDREAGAVPQPQTPAAPADPLPEPVPIFQVTQMPGYLHKAGPGYPPAMRRQGKEGVVILEVLIDARGKVRQVEVVKSAGPEFDDAAVAAMKDSTFAPARRQGEPVPVRLRETVTFRLR